MATGEQLNGAGSGVMGMTPMKSLMGYRLTAKGRRWRPVLEAIRDWGLARRGDEGASLTRSFQGAEAETSNIRTPNLSMGRSPRPTLPSGR